MDARHQSHNCDNVAVVKGSGCGVCFWLTSCQLGGKAATTVATCCCIAPPHGSLLGQLTLCMRVWEFKSAWQERAPLLTLWNDDAAALWFILPVLPGL